VNRLEGPTGHHRARSRTAAPFHTHCAALSTYSTPRNDRQQTPVSPVSAFSGRPAVQVPPRSKPTYGPTYASRPRAGFGGVFWVAERVAEPKVVARKPRK
jgi:hypothetical protein